jgi:hypothetical protein
VHGFAIEPIIPHVTTPTPSPYPGYMYVTGKSNLTNLVSSKENTKLIQPTDRDASMDDCIKVCDNTSGCKGIWRYMYKGKWSCALKSSSELTSNIGEDQLFYFK